MNTTIPIPNKTTTTITKNKLYYKINNITNSITNQQQYLQNMNRIQLLQLLYQVQQQNDRIKKQKNMKHITSKYLYSLMKLSYRNSNQSSCQDQQDKCLDKGWVVGVRGNSSNNRSNSNRRQQRQPQQRMLNKIINPNYQHLQNEWYTINKQINLINNINNTINNQHQTYNQNKQTITKLQQQIINYHQKLTHQQIEINQLKNQLQKLQQQIKSTQNKVVYQQLTNYNNKYNNKQQLGRYERRDDLMQDDSDDKFNQIMEKLYTNVKKVICVSNNQNNNNSSKNNNNNK